MAQPVYPQFRKYPCVRALTFRAQQATSSAVASSVGGTASPGDLAVFRLMTKSNFCWLHYWQIRRFYTLQNFIPIGTDLTPGVRLYWPPQLTGRNATLRAAADD
jgi:hypothetical protein